MPSMYERLTAVLELPVEERKKLDLDPFFFNDIVTMLRSKVEVFRRVKPEVIADMVQNCLFQTKPPDHVFIKQGETGDRMFVIMRGSASIFVIQSEREGDSPDTLALVEAVCNRRKDKLERSALGNCVHTAREGAIVGDVALMKEDNKRTATVVTDEETDLLVVDRQLFSRTVGKVLQMEFAQKTDFVERNPLFRNWAPRYRRALVMGLTKEEASYGTTIVRQGQPASHMYFILSGEVNIQLDPAAYRHEFPRLWSEMESLLPGLLNEDHSVVKSPHEALRERKEGHKRHQVCLLGENEEIGALEMLQGMELYLQTASATATCQLLVLSAGQFDRMFRRKYASQTVDRMKSHLASRLCLYIHQLPPRPEANAFLKFLNMKMEDAALLRSLGESRRRFSTAGGSGGLTALRSSALHEEGEVPEDVRNLRKRLHMRPDEMTSLPGEDTTLIMMRNLERRLQQWGQSSGLAAASAASSSSSSSNSSSSSSHRDSSRSPRYRSNSLSLHQNSASSNGSGPGPSLLRT